LDVACGYFLQTTLGTESNERRHGKTKNWPN